MSTKIKSASVVAARIVLGLIYFVFGLNFFFHFIPTPPSGGGPADAMAGGLFQSGYFFPMLKGIEVVFGALLLTGLFIPLTLVVLMPVTLNIFLFHAFLTPENYFMGLVMVVIHLYLVWSYRESYKGLLIRKAAF